MRLLNKLCLTTLTVLTLTAIPAFANQGMHWVSSSGNWYLYNNNKPVQNAWFQDNDGSWYYLDYNGIMLTGWFKDIDGSWYLLDYSGAMLTGWQNVNGRYYYLNANHGGRLTVDTVTPDGYRVDKNGAWDGSAKLNETSTQTNDLDAYKQEVFELVNHYRRENGVSPLTYSTKLDTIADIRAKELATLFSHDRPSGDISSLYREKGYSFCMWAENIAYGQTTPEAVMSSWMNSSGHRANILNPNLKELGVGIYESNGIIYWSQNFGSTDCGRY